MGWYPPYDDMKLADISAGNPELKIPGVGVQALRPALFEFFLEQYGYEARIDQFKHYEKLGMKENVCFLGFPSKEHRDNTIYCGKDSSILFKDMYLPIWDKGENGTTINDKNPYALYVYKTVKNYKNQVKYWEIWNEPDYAYSYKTELKPEQPGSWWSNNPDPCDYILHAPIQHYIRMLRISYEVIKSIDSSAYVTVGGIGFPSFLDGILRQTDNPDNGKVTATYPLKGGAYFDVLSYHTYPHIDNSVREWSDKVNGFVHFRHSDRAAEGILTKKKRFDEVLTKYGYQGTTYPKKHYIITESNIPAKEFGEFMGTYEAQKNFILKAVVLCQKNKILQFHPYSIGELMESQEARNEFDLMGLYHKLEGKIPYTSTVTESGTAYKTASDLLKGYNYDSLLTQSLLLPPNIEGAAYKNQKGEKSFVLWAKTNTDRSEKTEANYSFPKTIGIKSLQQKEWDFSKTQTAKTINPQSVHLTGSPSFFSGCR
jgi:hypothetical protein